jgi:hypothetical protein
MTNNPPTGYHPNNRWVLSCKQQIIALSKACNVNNTNILEHKIVVFSLSRENKLQFVDVLLLLIRLKHIYNF